MSIRSCILPASMLAFLFVESKKACAQTLFFIFYQTQADTTLVTQSFSLKGLSWMLVSSSAWWILIKLQLLWRFHCNCHLSHTWKDMLPVRQVDFKYPFSVSSAFTHLLKTCSRYCKLLGAVIKQRDILGFAESHKNLGLNTGRSKLWCQQNLKKRCITEPGS